MPHWSHIRAQARLRHREVQAYAASAAPHTATAALNAAQLLAYTETLTGLVRIPLASGDPLLYGAQATLDDGFIYYNAEITPWLALYYQAHEFAHHWLHNGGSLCSDEDVDYTESEDKSLYGEGRIEAYGPHQRSEMEANVFAREFLLPGYELRRWYVEENLNAAQISERSGLGLDFVLHSLAYALLAPNIEESLNAPDTDEASAISDATALTLDESQRAAAHSAHTPLLVAAGPGTGKTRTLVGRILHLLDEDVAPDKIVALTFSNKAGEEMRERFERLAPDAAPKIWIGTFHAFGLELLRRYWQQAALPPRARVLDPVDALFILERHLPQLGLDYYQNLYEPTTHLASILAAISRAKDELVSPDKYEELAGAMLAPAQNGGDAEATRKAERAMEVARAYHLYQNYLEREGLLDFGDLIFRTASLLREQETVRAELQAQYRHVLVDEYQDVNRACGVLLGLLANRGEGLWVVGDTRQAVYRWRGAAPAQVRHFLKDFPHGRTQALTVNYRSLPTIVRLISAVASQMAALPSMGHTETASMTGRADFSVWHAHRQERDTALGEQSAIRFEIATNMETEAHELAQLIKSRKERGVPFRAQAVICRKHSQLVKFARALEAEGVPALYLGDIFARSEVRDLLALVALASDGSGRTLPRVARFPEYNIPLREVRAILQAAKETRREFPDALTSLNEIQEFAAFSHNQGTREVTTVTNGSTNATGEESRTSTAGLARLIYHLARVAHLQSPWKMLAHYLFIHSRYLAPVLADDSSAGAQRRLAIYQLLQFIHNEGERAVEATNETDARRAILRYVRRLKSLAEDKGLHPVPVSAEGLDAVRLTTVHGAKGLEWSCVYLPYLGRGHFPAKRQHEPCPPPAGMIETFSAGDGSSEIEETSDAGEAQKDTHLEEEECLFFVALSRARDRLCLSRAERYGSSNSKASELLEKIEEYLPRAANSAATWHTEIEQNITDVLLESVPQTPAPKPRFTERQLGAYLKCPRKFFYEQRLYLSGKGEETAYLRFHACVYETLAWLAGERMAGRLVEGSADAFQESAQAQLTRLWQVKGPVGHVYESFYREQAALMVERAVRHYSRARGQLFHQTWTIERPGALVSLTPDYMELVEETDGATILFRHTRTGKPPTRTPDDDTYALFYAIAAEHFAQARPRVEILYLSTDEIIELNLSQRTINTRIKHYDDAISGILAGEFPPEVSDHQCPRCAHFFTCPKAED
ncbi:MAG: ATP-dependent helicase UvrD/PcrA [Acidobacteriota bacterium]|jgi:superfamily I DNA/RNA helicase/Zn-dependent peptidase ImmA (M78 family)/CRISPR/Cas system-associated exonuclease Cas4 (RecB family)|nr:ATP-dependent helicase UvrD/PcrA [Acidobacteriota bacterium]